MALDEYSVRTASAFEDDLDRAVSYYLRQSGPQSATRFLDEYDSFRETVSLLPGHGTPVGDSGLRWRPIGVFVVIYMVAEQDRSVMLLRLYYLSSNWKERILSS